jgi:integrase
MKGHIRERSPGHFAIVIDVPDPKSGQRRRKWHAFRGTRREAQRECARLIAELSSGHYVERSKTETGEFVKARIDQWQAADDISARSAERYRGLLDNQIAPHLGSVPLQKLSRLMIEGWHTALRNTGISAKTTGIAHRVLGKALADAERDGLVIKNVCKIQRAPKVRDRKQITIVHDVPGLVAKLRGHRLYTIAITALFTGMRLGEILALRDQCLDLDRGVIRVQEALEPVGREIRFKAPKTASGRRNISLPTIVIEALRTHRRELLELRMRLGLGRLNPDDLIFSNPEGRPLHSGDVSGAWSKFADQASIPEITFHALRHTHVSWLIAHGVDVVTISKRLGHANPNITLGTYAHLFDANDGKVADAINAAFPVVG